MSFFKIGAISAWVCIGAFILFILYANYDAYLSPNAVLGKENASNIRMVRIGMDTLQVSRIMGRAEGMSSQQQEHIYHYTHQPGTSNSYQIVCDANFKVKEIHILD